MAWSGSVRIVLLAVFAVLAVVIAVQSLMQAFGPTGDRLTADLAFAVQSFEKRTSLN